MAKADVKFGEWIEQGFDLYKKNIGLLILASLIAILLSSITFGILAGPMMAGLILITLRLKRGDDTNPEAGDVFRGFQHFLQTFLFCLAWGLIFIVANLIFQFIPCLGTLLSLAMSLILGSMISFGLYLIVDKNMEFWPASMVSINVVKTNLWPFVGFLVVANLVGSIGAILCGIGIVVTYPLWICMLTVAYEDVFNQAGGSEVAEADQGQYEEPPSE